MRLNWVKIYFGLSINNQYWWRRNHAPHWACRCLTSSISRPRHLSWKVRYRTFLWFFIQMSKLYKARSLLYRRQILQVNIRWKALDEIYKIYMLLHRSDLNTSEKIRQTFSHLPFSSFFSASFGNILQKIRYFWILLTDFCSDVNIRILSST